MLAGVKPQHEYTTNCGRGDPQCQVHSQSGLGAAAGGGRCAVLPSLVHTAGFAPWAGDVPMAAAQVWAPLLLMREEPCSLCLLYWL